MDKYTHGTLKIVLGTNSKSSMIQRFGNCGQKVISKPILIDFAWPFTLLRTSTIEPITCGLDFDLTPVTDI